MRSWLILLPFTFSALLPACGKPEPGDTDTAAETDATETDAMETDATETGATETGALGSTTMGPSPACGFEDATQSLCAKVEVTCDPDTGESVLVDEVALKCALEAFRDRKPGAISVSTCAGMSSFSTLTWYLRADGTAKSTAQFQADSCSYSGSVDIIALDEPADYENCLADPDWQKQVACLGGTTLETCEPATECAEDSA